MPQCTWISDEIFTVDGLLSHEECDAYIKLSESLLFRDAPVITHFGAQFRSDIRNNTRVILDDTLRAEELWGKAREYVPQVLDNWHAVGVNERLRFYRYDPGQRFNWHIDSAFRRKNGDTSKLTFMIYLNDGFEGGETSFNATSIIPKKGMALFFIHQIQHKGEIVIEGRKYVLRTDVMYRSDAMTATADGL
jgi:hypothetical protein